MTEIEELIDQAYNHKQTLVYYKCYSGYYYVEANGKKIDPSIVVTCPMTKRDEVRASLVVNNRIIKTADLSAIVNALINELDRLGFVNPNRPVDLKEISKQDYFKLKGLDFKNVCG